MRIYIHSRTLFKYRRFGVLVFILAQVQGLWRNWDKALTDIAAKGLILPDMREASIGESVQTCALYLQDLDWVLCSRRAIPLVTVRFKGREVINTWRMHTETLIKRTDRVPPWFDEKKGGTERGEASVHYGTPLGLVAGGGTKIFPSIKKFKRAVQYESKGGLAITLRCYFYITCCSRLAKTPIYKKHRHYFLKPGF